MTGQKKSQPAVQRMGQKLARTQPATPSPPLPVKVLQHASQPTNPPAATSIVANIFIPVCKGDPVDLQKIRHTAIFVRFSDRSLFMPLETLGFFSRGIHEKQPQSTN